MMSWAGRWTRTPSTTPLQPEKWNAHFWITFTFWWSARLVNGLKPCLPPLSSQKSEMLILGLRSTSDDQPGWLMDSNPICHPSPAKKLKCSFLDYVQLLMISQAGHHGLLRIPHHPSLAKKSEMLIFGLLLNFWWSAMAGICIYIYGLKPHLPPLSSQTKWNAHFWITFTFWWLPGWSMDLNPTCHPSLAKKVKCSFLDYVQLLMIGWAGWWTQSPIRHPSPAKKVKCSFLDYVQLLMIGGLVDGLEAHLPPSLQPKNEMLIFGLRSTSDDWPGWSMDSNPIPPPLSSQKMKCSFLDYVQLLMISRAGQWTQTPSATPLQPKKMKCSFLDYVQLLMIGRAGRWTRTPSTTPL